MDNQLLEAMRRITGELAPFWDLSLVLAYIIGAVSVVAGLFILAREREQKSGAYAAIIFGALLLGLPTVLDFVSQTLFEQNAPQALSSGTVGGGADDVFVAFAVRVAQLVGLVGFIKGLCILTKIGANRDGGGSVSHAVTYMTAGIVCINIVVFIRLLGDTIGDTFQQVVNRLFAGM
jgi:hypothetical protein